MIFESAQDGEQFELRNCTHMSDTSADCEEEGECEIILRVVLIVDPLQLTDVQVPHSLQPLQLRLDLRLLLQDRK